MGIWLTVDTGGGVVLDAQIDVLLDAEAERAHVREVPLEQLELLHLEAGLLQRLVRRARRRGLRQRRGAERGTGAGWIPPAAHQQLHGLLAADGHVARDLLVTTDLERTNGVPGTAEHGLLAGQLLQNLGGLGQAIARLADTDVQDHLGDLSRAGMGETLVRGGPRPAGERPAHERRAGKGSQPPQVRQPQFQAGGKRSSPSAIARR